MGNVPRLRFLGFSGEWEWKTFDKVYSLKVTNSFSRDKLNYEKGLVKNIHYGDIHTKFFTLFDIKKEVVPYINPLQSIENIKPENYCVEGDIIFADASEDLNDIGKNIEIINLNNEKLLSGLHTLLARLKKADLIIGFGGYLFKSNIIRNQIKKESQGTKVLGLSGKRLSAINIYFPKTKKEQQKIANCLSSIDQVITVQTQKLDSLKAHKKGLMQQLFPAEGESIPKLRFPEFWDAGDWEKAKLGDKEVSEFIKDRVPLNQLDINSYISTKNLLPDYAGIKVAIKLPPSGSFTQFKKKDILISNIRPYLKKVWQAQMNGSSSNDVIVIRAKNRIINNFLMYLLKNDYFISYVMRDAKGVKMPRGDISSIKKYPVFYPEKPEQQKIASCLSSLDNLITTQTQKIETLKAHKKGLMQQLFPSNNVSTNQ